MKKTKETENFPQRRAFALHSVPEQGNKKNRITAFLIDCFFLWLYLAGLAVWLVSALELPASMWLCLVIQGTVAFVMQLAFLGQARARLLKLLTWCAALLLFALLFQNLWRSGLYIICNQGVEELGKKFPYVFPAYMVTMKDGMKTAALYGALIWLAALAALPGFYMVRFGNRMLLGIQIAAFFVIWMVAGICPKLTWGVFAMLCFFSVWIRGHGEQIPAGRQRLAVLEAFALAAAGVVLLAVGGNLLVQKFSLGEIPFFSDSRKSLTRIIDEARYQGSSTVLPEGQFSGLGSFKTEKEPVLEVTMSQPESYYLRGFTGADYTGKEWLGSDASSLWKNRNLFYWLHEDGFYGQECLGDAAVALSEDAAAEDQNTITIKNPGGSSRYYYVPYELRSEQSSQIREELDSQKIGDSGLLAAGLNGSREYSYKALPNQIIKYPAYDAALLKEDTLSEEGKAYKEKEEYYNEFAYGTYLEIPRQLNAVLFNLLGNNNIAEGEKHTDYAEAKQNILYVLASAYTDTNELEGSWDGSDFIFDFLQLTKKGYSVHFASAAAMMFRYYGIPSRYVEGYLVTPEDVKHMTAGEAYILDDTHAHAWVEYYQDGVGWLPFETTPSYLNTMDKADEYQDISGMDKEGSDNQNEEKEEEKEEQEPEEEQKIDWIAVLTILVIIGICLLALTMLAFLVWVILQRNKSKKAKRLFTSPDKRIAVRALYDYSMNILSVAGLEIHNVSLYRYEKSIGRMFDEETALEYHAVVGIRQEAVYSSNEITEEHRLQAEEFKNKIWNRVYRSGTTFQKFQLKFIYFL